MLLKFVYLLHCYLALEIISCFDAESMEFFFARRALRNLTIEASEVIVCVLLGLVRAQCSFTQ